MASDNFQKIGEKFGVAQYQIAALSDLLKRTTIAGKRVLEVGGSNLPRDFVIDRLGAREWVSVDIIAEGRYQLLHQSDHYSREGINSFEEGSRLVGRRPYVIINGQIEHASLLPSFYFDLIVSITSFEHILAVASALRQIRRMKTETGHFYTYHGPIWSSWCGHHVRVDETLNFNTEGIIPSFGHLLYSPPEMYELLMRSHGHDKAERVVAQMYHEPRINRLFYEDYEEYFLRAGFSEVECEPYGVSPPSERIFKALQTRHSRYSCFDSYGMIAFAR